MVKTTKANTRKDRPSPMNKTDYVHIKYFYTHIQGIGDNNSCTAMETIIAVL